MKTIYSPSAQRLPKACSDTPGWIHGSLYPFLIGSFLTRLMIGHILAKYLNINIVTHILFFRSKPGLALHLKRLTRSCLIRPCIVIYAVGSSKRETKLSKGWKQFDVLSEIESLEISLRSTENKYVCRNCVAKLKKRRSLIEQTEKLEAELKRLGTSEDLLPLKRNNCRS